LEVDRDASETISKPFAVTDKALGMMAKGFEATDKAFTATTKPLGVTDKAFGPPQNLWK